MKYLPTILLAISGLASVFAPSITKFESAHSAAFGAIAAVVAAILHWLPSPSPAA